MNLFLNPSINELRRLMRDNDNEKTVHDIVVDYDGEVLVDPDLKQPELKPERFKFRIRLHERPRNFVRDKSEKLRQLFNKLVDGWENSTGSYQAEGAV